MPGATLVEGQIAMDIVQGERNVPDGTGSSENVPELPDQVLDFDDECPWPRRLLHIPTMTSYPWTPGDSYGGHRRPKYVALSYTWGRWCLHGKDHPEVQHLAVNGVPWPIPRIDPLHFTAVEFESTIRALPAVSWTLNTRENFRTRRYINKGSETQIHFAWVDIACIDQRNESEEAAREIGRQAKIFGGAVYTFAWLTTHANELIHDPRANVKGLWQRMKAPNPDTAVQYVDKKTSELIECLTSDHYFSSLWTIQEASVSRRIAFLSRNAELWRVSPRDSFIHLSDLLRLLTEFDPGRSGQPSEIIYRRKFRSITAVYEKAYRVIQQGETQPIAIVLATQHRETTHEVDRVYAIMQIFNFRLGRSRPGVDHQQQFTLPDLDDELGQALMEKDPVSSQLHVFTEAPERNKGWRFARTSRLAFYADRFLWRSLRSSQYQISNSVKLSAIFVGEDRIGTFLGRMCKLRDLSTAWLALPKTPPSYAEFNYSIELDLSIAPPVLDDASQLNVLLRDRSDVSILFLGTGEELSKTHQPEAFGLILVPYGRDELQHHDRYWRRIGLCRWRIPIEPRRASRRGPWDMEYYSLMAGESDAWEDASGYFA